MDLISRADLAALTEEAAKVTGIPCIMNAYRDEALEIIDTKPALSIQGRSVSPLE